MDENLPKPTDQPTNPSETPTQPAIVASKPETSKTVWIVAGVLVVLVLAVVAYAYTSGILSQPTTTPTQTTSQTPVTDDMISIETTSAAVETDMTDVDSAAASLDSIDFGGDEAPAL